LARNLPNKEPLTLTIVAMCMASSRIRYDAVRQGKSTYRGLYDVLTARLVCRRQISKWTSPVSDRPLLRGYCLEPDRRGPHRHALALPVSRRRSIYPQQRTKRRRSRRRTLHLRRLPHISDGKQCQDRQGVTSGTAWSQGIALRGPVTRQAVRDTQFQFSIVIPAWPGKRPRSSPES
jgi:hypothetical protein